MLQSRGCGLVPNYVLGLYLDQHAGVWFHKKYSLLLICSVKKSIIFRSKELKAVTLSYIKEKLFCVKGIVWSNNNFFIPESAVTLQRMISAYASVWPYARIRRYMLWVR